MNTGTTLLLTKVKTAEKHDFYGISSFNSPTLGTLN